MVDKAAGLAGEKSEGEKMFRNENEFVAWIKSLDVSAKGLKRVDPHGSKKGVRLGIGDDAALVTITRGHELILTADMSIEGVHFSRPWHPAEAVGHRALARSLSDVAAMGGVPRYVLVSLAASRRVNREWIAGLYRGMLALARSFSVRLVGGDTALVSGKTFIDVLVAGEAPKGRSLLRSGARPGDKVFVSGQLGLSALGLRLLRKTKKGRSRLQRNAVAMEALRAHLYPIPQCALGKFLSGGGIASAMMDLSDGLSTDLSRLCAASGVGARLWAAKVPGPDLPNAEESLQLALHGGEDYQLLFTVPRSKIPRLPAKFRGHALYHLGEIEASKGMKLVMLGGEVRILERQVGTILRRCVISNGRGAWGRSCSGFAAPRGRSRRSERAARDACSRTCRGRRPLCFRLRLTGDRCRRFGGRLGLGSLSSRRPSAQQDFRPGAGEDFLHLVGVGQKRRVGKLLDGPVLQNLAHELHPDGQRHTRSFFLVAQGLVVIKAHVDAAGDGRGEAEKPGVGEIVGGTRLARHGVFLGQRLGVHGRAGVEDLPQHRNHEARDRSGKNVRDFRLKIVDHPPVVVGHAVNHARRDVDAVVGESGEGGGVLEQGQVRGAQAPGAGWEPAVK